MLVHEQYRKCVGFVFVDVVDEVTNISKRTPVATVFFVAVPTVNGDGMEHYAVTARHVVDRSSAYGEMHLRLNKLDGGCLDLTVSPGDWCRHPSSDVAVIHIVPPSGLDVMFIHSELLATDDYIKNHSIIEGDKVFFVGLFSQTPGLQRSQPIVRFGNIALMPREPIPVKLDPESETTTPIDAYLVEARSWGGHSGAPAFVYYADTDRLAVLVTVKSDPPSLLGLVHGHYEIEQDVAFIGDILGSGKVPLNAGMALVIPAQHIIDTLAMASTGG